MLQIHEDLNRVQKAFKNYANKNTVDIPENGLDYYKGSWSASILFFMKYIDTDLIEDKNLLKALKYLMDIGFIGATYNIFKKGTEVPLHDDSDLILMDGIIRVFIPLEQGYNFEFEGSYINLETFEVSRGFKEPDDLPIYFLPRSDHSYKNLDSFDHKFIIGDLLPNPDLNNPEVLDALRHYCSTALFTYGGK